MKIAFYGGQTAGLVVLLALQGLKHDLKVVIPDDDRIFQIAQLFNLPIADKTLLNTGSFTKDLSQKIDLFICCHGWKILNKTFVTSLKCINFHPCLYKYKGLHPIARLIADNNSRASVATHWMNEKIDSGESIVETFKKIANISGKTEADIYNELYPLYIETLVKTLDNLEHEKQSEI